MEISLSLIIFVVGGVAILVYLDKMYRAQVTPVEKDWADDPIITGERNSWGWHALNILGGLLNIPFVLVNSLINALEGFGEALDPTISDETAIVPVDKGE